MEVVLVHFEAETSETLSVCSNRFYGMFQRELATVALERYNALHSTNYTLDDCTISGTIRMSETIPCDLNSYVHTGDDFEMVIRLPNYVKPPDPKLPDHTIAHMIELGESFMSRGDSGSASLFFAAAGFHGSDHVAERHWSVPPGPERRRYWKVLESFGWPDSLDSDGEESQEEPPRSPESRVFAVQSNEDVEANLIALAKTNPNHVIHLILSDIQMYRYLPVVCRNSPAALETLTKLIELLNAASDAKMAIGEILLKKGMISAGLEIGFNPDVVSVQPALTHAKKMWVMWSSGDIGPLYYNIVAFLDYYQKEKIGTLSIASVYTLMDSIKKGTHMMKSKNHGIVPKQIDRTQLALFRVVCLSGVFLYTQGMMTEYGEIREMLDPKGTEYFEKFKDGFDVVRDAPEFLLYARSGKENSAPWRDSDIPFAIGDETLMDDGFHVTGFSPSMFHAVTGLSLWKIRKKHSMEASAFWNLVEMTQRYNMIYLQLGWWDLCVTIPKLLQDGVVGTVARGMEYVIGIYGSIIEEVEERTGKKVYVKYLRVESSHPMRPQVVKFNHMLAASLPDSVTLCGDKEPKNES